MSEVNFTKKELEYLFQVIDGVNDRGLEKRALVVSIMTKLETIYKQLSKDKDEATLKPKDIAAPGP